MMRRYATLLAAVLVVGALLARTGAHHGATSAAAPVTHAAPTVHLPVRIEAVGVTPSRASVAVGTRIELSVENATPRAVHVSLSGYEDRATVPTLAPGARWTTTLTADRPGEDFSWLIDGTPTGRFVVMGSHLVDGHR